MLELPSRYLLVQRQQWKSHNNVWNLLKVNNAISVALVSSLLTVQILHIILVSPLLALNK